MSTKESSIALRTGQILMPLYNIIKNKKQGRQTQKEKMFEN
jgi:hypothetical protein